MPYKDTPLSVPRVRDDRQAVVGLVRASVDLKNPQRSTLRREPPAQNLESDDTEGVDIGRSRGARVVRHCSGAAYAGVSEHLRVARSVVASA